MASRPSPFTRLPIELVHRVLELAAMESQHAAFTITFVSKEVQQIITPILYQTVTLRVYYQTGSFYNTLQAKNSTTGLYVRNLAIPDDDMILDSEIGAKIISRCPHVQRLIMERTTDPPMGMESSWPSPWEVAFLTPYSIGRWFSHPILQDVTHLFLYHLSHQNGVSACLSLPHLTHLALRCDRHAIDSSFAILVMQLLDRLLSLEMLLLHSDTLPVASAVHFIGRNWVLIADNEDKRLFGRPGIIYYELRDRLRSGLSVWEDAKVNHADWRAEVRRGVW